MKRIAIVGPESSGKSTLASGLARRLGAPKVEEYARQYLATRPPGYRCDQDDLIAIARAQRRHEEAIAHQQPAYLVCDTNVLVIQIWCEFKIGPCPAELLALRHFDRYFLHLVLLPDLPWSPDPLREDPDPAARQRIFDRSVRELEEHNAPYAVVGGQQAEARLNNALTKIAAAEHLNPQ